GADSGNAIAVNAAGDAYLAGFRPIFHPPGSATLLAKVYADGSVAYATGINFALGPSQANGLAVADGFGYVAGWLSTGGQPPPLLFHGYTDHPPQGPEHAC